MGSTFWVWLAVGVYVVLGFLIAVAARRQVGVGMSGFFLANRKVGGFISAMTYSATTYSAFMLVGLVGLTYAGGVGALGFELTYLCGLFLALFFLPRFWLAGRKYGYITPMELLSDRYQSKYVGMTAGVLSLVFLVPYSAAQLMGVSFLINGLSGGAIPVVSGIILATLLAIAWSRIAGLRSIAWTDAFQALIMIVSGVVILGIVVSRVGGWPSFFGQIESGHPDLLTVPSGGGMWNINMFIGLSLPWFFFCISNPQVSQRFFIPKSVTAMKRMLGGFLVFGFAYTLIAVLLGFGARLLVPGLEKADMATPALLALPVIPRALALVVMVGIMAAAISTIDSILLTLSSVWARDIHRAVISPGVSESRELRIGQWVIPVVAGVAFVFAWQVSAKTGLDFMIAPLSAASSAGLLMVVPAIIGAFYWKKATATGAIVSSAVGAILVLILQITGYKPLGWWPGTWGIIVCTMLFVVVSLATKPPLKKAEEFLHHLKRELASGNFV